MTIEEMMTTIKAEASALYQARIPDLVEAGLTKIGTIILDSTELTTEFCDALVGKIAYLVVVGKMFKNPLANLKGISVPYGKSIQEIYVNPVVGTNYDNDGNKLLVQTSPDAKAMYYYLNRKSSYPITITNPDLQQAFTNEDEMMSLTNKIIQSMYSGDEIDEFTLMKSLIGKAVDLGKVVKIEVPELNATNAKEISKAISLVSSDFAFPKSAYNGYNVVNATAIASGDTACITWCPLEDQVILMRNDVQTEMNYEVLATAFNMDKASIQAMTILVDDFGMSTTNIYAVLCDRSAIQVRDNLFRVADQKIASNLTWNYWLHHWEWLYVSMFGNMVAFTHTTVVTP